MNRQERRRAGKSRKAVLALLVAGALATGGEIPAYAATGDATGNWLQVTGHPDSSNHVKFNYGAGSGTEVNDNGDLGAQGLILTKPGDSVKVDVNGNLTLVSDSVTSTLMGEDESDNKYGAYLDVSGRFDVKKFKIASGSGYADEAPGGEAHLKAGTYVVKKGYALTITGNTPRIDIDVSTFEFDLIGAVGDDTFLDVYGVTGNFDLAWILRNKISFANLTSLSNANIGNVFVLISSDTVFANTGSAFTPGTRTQTVSGNVYTFDIDEVIDGSYYKLVAELISIEPVSPPYIPPPEDPSVKTFTENELNRLRTNGIIFYEMAGNLNRLEINVPLKWFMENLGVTLLVYNKNLGLMAITSENMIELAALSYTGTGGVTFEMHGKEYTINPNTMVSYVAVKGSIILSVKTAGRLLNWYVYDSPLILGIPENGAEGDDWVAYKKMDDGSEKIIPRSLVRDGLLYTLVNDEGEYAVKKNPVSFSDTEGIWMDEAVRFVGARGIMRGIGGDVFAPNRTLTRSEFVTMLMRMLDYKLDDFDPMPFSDIVPETWYYDSVCKAAALGLTSGRGDGTFGIRDVITRQEMFKMTYDALRLFYLIIPETDNADEEGAEVTESPLAAFSDVADIDPDALEALEELVRNGLVSGSRGRLFPNSNLSRADAAQFMTNVIRFIVPDYSEYMK